MSFEQPILQSDVSACGLDGLFGIKVQKQRRKCAKQKIKKQLKNAENAA